MNKGKGPFEEQSSRAAETRTKIVNSDHRDMIHRVFVKDVNGAPELYWRTAQRLKSYHRWFPLTKKLKFAEEYGNTPVIGKRMCYGHGVVFRVGRNCYLSETVIMVLMGTLDAEMEVDNAKGKAQYFTELEQRMDNWTMWPAHAYRESSFADPALANIVEKAQIRAVAYHGMTVLGWTSEQLVKWWIDFTVGLKDYYLVWKRAPVRGGPNALKPGDPVMGMLVSPVGRVVTISGVTFLISDVVYYMQHDRFPWEPVGTRSPWKVEVEEVNWDD